MVEKEKVRVMERTSQELGKMCVEKQGGYICNKMIDQLIKMRCANIYKLEPKITFPKNF